jgi:hypothetical protein
MIPTFVAVLSLSLASPPANQRILGASLFKNGYALVTHEIDVPSSGEYEVKSAPQGSLGTVWFTTTEGVRLESVVSTTIETKRSNPVQSLDAVLRANVGSQITLVVRKDSGATDSPLTGKLVAAEGDIVVLQTGGDTVAIPKASIIRVSAPTGELKYTTESKNQERVLRMRVSASKPGKVRLSALERGMTWAPGYAVDISDEKKLTFVAKSTVLNDLADIENVELKFITGFPNVPFIGVPDPLTSGASLDQFISFLGGMGPVLTGGMGPRGGRMGDAMTQNAPAMDMGGGMPVSPLEGMQAGDLFFYRQPGVTLKKGDRGYYILFRAESTYDHLYTWDVIDFVTQDTYQPTWQDQPQDVWHSLKFRNTSGQPLTTAAATTFKDGQILGQDMMSYTPVGADVLLRVTKALDVRAETTEEEVSRERAALRVPSGGTYDLVTLRGTLTVTNRKTEDVKIKITKTVTGEVVSSSGSAKVTKTAKGMRDVNSRATIVWEATIPSGKASTFTYDYKLYVRT